MAATADSSSKPVASTKPVASAKAKTKTKRYRACRGVNLLTPDGEARFEPGDEITCSIPLKAISSWVPRGIIEEMH